MTTQAPWSLEPLIRFSPRRVTLDPGETQVVRIALRRNLNRPEGEYFSHIRVLTLTEIPDGSDTVDPTVQSVKISARTAIAVPVIWRNSPNDQAAKINLATLDDGAQNLLVEVQRQGHLSVRGFLHLRCNDGGKSRSMMDPVPLVIYPTNRQKDGKSAVKRQQKVYNERGSLPFRTRMDRSGTIAGCVPACHRKLR